MTDDPWTAGPFATGSRDAERRLRRHMGAILRAALEAVEPGRLVRDALRDTPLPDGPIRVIAMGKAAGAMARAAAAVLGDRIRDGVVVVPHASGADPARPRRDVDRTAGTLPGNPAMPGVRADAACRSPAVVHPLACLTAGHPEPDAGSVAAGRAILDAVRTAHPGDVLLALVSGGGSALVALPPAGVTLDDVAAVTGALLRGGAPIEALNAVRKHLDDVKGGRLARAFGGRRLLALLLSDVPGDRPAVIASGPFAPDRSGFRDAVAAMHRYGAWERAPKSVRDHMERGARGDEPESAGADDPCFERVENVVIGGNRTALGAAGRAAASLGYRVVIEPDPVVGEAREVGRRFAAAVAGSADSPGPRDRGAAGVSPTVCRLAGGEPTVTVRGAGRGGRNQEVALAAAIAIDGMPGIVIAALGTDGIDGPTDAAGAIADGCTLLRARERTLDPADHLARNDSYPFFHSLDDLIVTGPTGTNVMDVIVGLKAGG